MTAFTAYGPIVVPVLTPFDDRGRLDLDAFTGLIRYVADAGNADALVVSGTTGEFFTQSTGERIQTFSAANDAAGDLPLIAGIGAQSTKETLELGQAAADLGYDTVMAVCPYYTRPNQAELASHFTTVAEAFPNLNVMLYNIPIFTGVNLEFDTLSELSAIGNINAIKDEAELNPKQITRYLNATPEDFIIYNGDDTMILESYAQGGADRIGGVISGASHLLGRFIRDMISTFVGGDLQNAVRMQRSLYPVLKIMGQNSRTNPAPLWKATMAAVGVNAGLPRSPLSAGTSNEVAAIVEVLRAFAAEWPQYLQIP